MKRITIIFSTLLITIAANAANWCETLVNKLNSDPGIDRTVAVSRSPETHEITNATYEYRFTSEKLYKQILSTMTSANHIAESDYYSESGTKNKTVVIRFTDNGRRWSCRLQSDSHNKQFLVSVKSGDGAPDSIVAEEETAQPRHTTGEARKRTDKTNRKARQTSRQTVETHTSADSKAALEKHQAELRQAEAERNRKLGQ